MALGGAVVLEPAVQFQDLGHGTSSKEIQRLLGVGMDGQDRGKDHLDAMGRGQFRQRSEIALGLLQGHRAGVPREIIGARQDDDHLRMQGDHICAEANEHLRCRLATDASIDVGPTGKGCVQTPEIRDRIAKEHDPGLSGGRGSQLRIGRAVARKLAPVVPKDRLHGVSAVLLELLVAGDLFPGKVHGFLGTDRHGRQSGKRRQAYIRPRFRQPFPAPCALPQRSRWLCAGIPSCRPWDRRRRFPACA